jgi:hypothetical protein
MEQKKYTPTKFELGGEINYKLLDSLINERYSLKGVPLRLPLLCPGPSLAGPSYPPNRLTQLLNEEIPRVERLVTKEELMNLRYIKLVLSREPRGEYTWPADSPRESNFNLTLNPITSPPRQGYIIISTNPEYRMSEILEALFHEIGHNYYIGVKGEYSWSGRDEAVANEFMRGKMQRYYDSRGWEGEYF